MKTRVNIIKTGSCPDLCNEEDILNEAISNYVNKNEHIINIQLIESNDLKRFWIYTIANNDLH